LNGRSIDDLKEKKSLFCYCLKFSKKFETLKKCKKKKKNNREKAEIKKSEKKQKKN